MGWLTATPSFALFQRRSLADLLPASRRSNERATIQSRILESLRRIPPPALRHAALLVNSATPALRFQGSWNFRFLRPTGDTVVYVPYYMPTTNEKFARSDDQFRAEAFRCLQMINPALCDEDLIAFHVGRLRYAQPVCPPGFAREITPYSDTDPRSPNRRHLFLLSRGPGHFRKRKNGKDNGGASAMRLQKYWYGFDRDHHRLMLFLLTGALAASSTCSAGSRLPKSCHSRQRSSWPISSE